jgi:Predicted nucleotide-binding protein containing TIR-like domain
LSKPLIVIGSSTESGSIAKALQESLTDELSSELWSQLGLPLSQQVLDGLEGAIGEADFAAFILSPDDKLEHRGKKTGATRDNVLMEFGVARGVLGKERAFLVLPDLPEDEFRIPSDLRGITGGPTNTTRRRRKRRRPSSSALCSTRQTRYEPKLAVKNSAPNRPNRPLAGSRRYSTAAARMLSANSRTPRSTSPTSATNTRPACVDSYEVETSFLRSTSTGLPRQASTGSSSASTRSTSSTARA